eukprot:TRINITY_DN4334_c0_g2_i3.p1 TRINITY_DN4334_c0_g2~~TRINITY_DN4334_c0_g2_i3.p1  ORF type:complete len:107 (-),score=22.08 TRINITY_DN4334_c0_g2_i3:153-473(-)
MCIRDSSGALTPSTSRITRLAADLDRAVQSQWSLQVAAVTKAPNQSDAMASRNGRVAEPRSRVGETSVRHGTARAMWAKLRGATTMSCCPHSWSCLLYTSPSPRDS